MKPETAHKILLAFSPTPSWILPFCVIALLATIALTMFWNLSL